MLLRWIILYLVLICGLDIISVEVILINLLIQIIVMLLVRRCQRLLHHGITHALDPIVSLEAVVSALLTAAVCSHRRV